MIVAISLCVHRKFAIKMPFVVNKRSPNIYTLTTVSEHIRNTRHEIAKQQHLSIGCAASAFITGGHIAKKNRWFIVAVVVCVSVMLFFLFVNLFHYLYGVWILSLSSFSVCMSIHHLHADDSDFYSESGWQNFNITSFTHIKHNAQWWWYVECKRFGHGMRI